ncbi:VWA domain-containing protein [Rheinheimera riviphila]|uniref:VWA domain-containing protein n=1 Tax=Rheinheimera riviphila TaxID=1834037 RepID=A0A437QT06_9GAMM|nr:VWA domain-containing protein [Rheinheimera riviphila]RVU37636.1 VWA domain-containing protein [Rheinheimera riviphila]
MLELSWPWLLLLLPLPWLVKSRQQNIAAAGLLLPPLAKMAQQHSFGIARQQKPKQWLMWLIWTLLVVAAAQPKWLGEPVSMPQQGRDMMLAVDLSGSMNISDMVIDGQAFNRLDAVKYVLNQFIEKRQGDRLGLVLFADAAYQQTPLTFDRKTVQQMLDEAVLGLVGQRTAIGEAIGLSVKRFNTYQSSNKVLILLSDGANTAGNIQPREALKLAKAAGVKIYTVGVGAEQMVQQGIFGPQIINPSDDLDEKLLTELASETGGRYFRARDLKELAQIYQLLDQLEPIERDQLTYRPQQSLLHWPLAGALLLITLLWLVQMPWSLWRRGRTS